MSKPLPSHLKTEQLLRQMNDGWVKALVRRDGEALNRIMADDFFFAYPMEGDDKSTFIDDIVSGAIKVEHIKRETMNVRIWGNTAVVTATDESRWAYQGRDFSGQYKVIQIYAQRNQEWQLVAVQACPII